MHYHFTNGELLAVGFFAILAMIFAISALLEMIQGRRPPFRNYFDSEYDRSLQRNGGFIQDETDLAGRQTSFEDLLARDRPAIEWHAEAVREVAPNRDGD